MFLWKIPKIYCLAHWLFVALMRCTGDQVVHLSRWGVGHWLTDWPDALLHCFACQPEPLSRWGGGGGESLICCCSSLTHTPTDSQIQFNRLFDDSSVCLYPPIHKFNLIDYLMIQSPPNNPITRQTLKQELLVICPDGNHHCITSVDRDNPTRYIAVTKN